MHKYFDDRWENMNLIYCFEVSNEEACVVKLNDVYALPVLNHYGSVGTGEGLPDKCDWYYIDGAEFFLYFKSLTTASVSAVPTQRMLPPIHTVKFLISSSV